MSDDESLWVALEDHNDIVPDLRAELANLRAAVRALRPDCGDHSCKFAAKKSGMRTNGGCRCVDIVLSDKRRAAEAALRRALESGEA